MSTNNWCYYTNNTIQWSTTNNVFRKLILSDIDKKNNKMCCDSWMINNYAFQYTLDCLFSNVISKLLIYLVRYS